MTIGIYNIFTSLKFLLLLSAGGCMTYLTIERFISDDLIFIGKIFLPLLSLIIIGISFFFLRKFRILIIRNNEIISIRPFVFKKIILHFQDIKKVKWIIWNINAVRYYKIVEVEDTNKIKISISDYEFENFEKIITSIKPIIKTAKSNKIYLEQAKNNISITNFILILTLLFVVFISILEFSRNKIYLFDKIICLISFLIIFTSFKRRKNYLRIIKNKNNILNSDVRET
jgi:hypothetical protein